jgi:hypothetical protein
MKTKNTILSQKDLDLLEKIVLQYGKTVSFDQIRDVMQGTASLGAVGKRVAAFHQAGAQKAVRRRQTIWQLIAPERPD